MNVWKIAALSAALVTAAGAGAPVMPVAHAQRAPRAAARPLEMLGLGGSRIGVTVRDLDQADLKGKPSAGVLVDGVEGDSPAEKAGFKKGDVITEFDGERVRSVRQFTRLVSETPAGRTVAAAVQRDGQRVMVNVTPRESNAFRFLEGDNWRVFGDMPPPPPAPPTPAVPPVPGAPPAPAPPPTPQAPRAPEIESFVWRAMGNQLGLTVYELSDQLAEYFGAKEGVLVTAVEDDSAAAKAGVKAGDVITSVNGASVSDVGDLRRRVQRLDEGEEFTLGIMRDKKPMTLKGKLERSSVRRRTIL